jgi:hypothetical protein
LHSFLLFSYCILLKNADDSKEVIKMKPTLATLEGVDLSAITEAEEKINKGHKEKIALVAYVTL